jgi:hypothetical protein
MGCSLSVAAAFPLALGSADVAVVAYTITKRSALSLVIASVAAAIFLTVC